MRCLQLAVWITDRTSSDVERVKAIAVKAKTGTWTEKEQAEWAAGMRGALSYLDYNRIESGMYEIATILNASISVKTNWNVNEYLTTADATRWIDNVKILRALCSGRNGTPVTPASIEELRYVVINQVEQVLSDVETIASDRLLYCSEPICGGEPYYALC